VKVCPKRADARDPKKLQREKLYNKYRPAQHKRRAQPSPDNNSHLTPPNQPAKPKSYAEIVNSKKPNDNTRRPWNRQNVRQTPNHKNDSNYQNLSKQINDVMILMESTFEKWNTRLDALAEKRKSRRNSRASSPSPSSTKTTTSPSTSSEQPPSKRTHSDVDSSSSDEPDEEIANIRTDMQKDMSMMKNMFTNFFTTMGLGGPSEEDHDTIVDDEMNEIEDDEVVDEFDTL